MTELLVGTKKGLFVLEGEPGDDFEITARAFAGEPVEYALRDPRSGRVLASVTSPFYGPKIFSTDDPAGEWDQAEGVELPEAGDLALERIWAIVPGEDDGTVYAGGDPGVLFVSRDGGATLRAQPGPLPAPDPPLLAAGRRRAVPALDRARGRASPTAWRSAISAAGVWLTDDGGAELAPRQRGPASPATCPRTRRPTRSPLCVHRIHRAPTRPERLFLQFHGGVYRSDDAGESWIDIADGLPSDFGFALAIDPADADSAYVIPLVADIDRVTARRQASASTRRATPARPGRRAANGLPSEDAYLTILREAIDWTGEGDALELYFGATSGAVYGSADGGAVAGSRRPPTCRPSTRVSRTDRHLDGDRRAAAPRRVDLEVAVERVDAVAQPAQARCRSTGPRRRRRRRGPGRAARRRRA